MDRMLSTKDIQTLLGQTAYKPGWEFVAYDGAHEGQHVTIKAKLEDAYNPGAFVDLQFETFVPPMQNAEAFFDWLLWRLKRIEVHECREFLKVAGSVYSDPHAEFADRDL